MLLPPGPTPRYPGEFIRSIVTDQLGFFNRMASHGDVSQLRIGRERLVLLTEPEAIRDVFVTNQRNFLKGRGLERAKALLGEGLLTSEGEFHLRQRRLAQPAFHRQRVAAYGAVMAQYTDERQGRWRHEETFDVHDEMMRLTLSIAAKTLFDKDIEREAQEVSEVIDLSLRLFRYAILPLGEYFEYLPIPFIIRLRRTRARMETMLYTMIRERRATGVDHGDLLSMLIAAQDDEGDHGGMTDQQLRDEMLTILLAGHETTAVALSWTWYLISQHPDVEAALHTELDSVLNGRTPTADDLASLTYTRMILSESMRLYPPAWVVGRRAIDEYEVGGYTIPARSVVLVSQYLTHRDPRWWPNPEQFDPERWRPNAIASRPKFSYFPFGAGTRVCIGEQFAWMEGILILATIAQRWRLRHDPSHQVALEPLITLRPKYGMRMQALQRSA